MSTRKKESVSSVREKGSRGSSPSLSPSHHLKSSPKKPSKTVSTSRSLDSSPSDKSIPNYLKPTLSSSGDATKVLQARRPVSNTDSALVRRRSFDKPPSPTRTLKSHGISPTPTFRSSSFSRKIGAGKVATTTASSPKGKSRDGGKQHSPLYARSVSTLKKSASGKSKSKKGEIGIGSSSRKEEEAKNDDVCNVHDASDQESSIAESEEHEEEQQSAVEDQEIHGEMDEVAASHEQIEDEVHKADSPTVLEHDHDHDGDGDDGKVESPTILEDREANVEENVSEVESPTLSEQDKVESPAASEKQDSINEDAAIDESIENSESPNVESQHEGDVSPAASDKSCIEEISSQEQEMKEHSANEVETSDPNEDDNKAETVVTGVEARANEEAEEKDGVKEEDENATPKVAHGKKDVALSNNVIEEMTREQRRNKVRALAGAFETVISLQEPKEREERRMCLVFVCDEDERVIGRQAAAGACPYCGGMVQALDVQSNWRFCFVPFYFKTKRKLYCSICSRRLVVQ